VKYREVFGVKCRKECK